MKKEETLSISILIEKLSNIEDPRRQWGNLRHRLSDILIIALLAIICGCESWEDIEDYGETKKEWLEELLGLDNSIPSADTFRRLFERIRPEALEKAYREWVTPYVGGCIQKQVNIDGKTIRGASKSRECLSNLHIVSAWVKEDGISMGQIKTAEKSNEITAIPELLSTLDVRGGVVSIDAMGCQKNIARQITKQEANYILAVKLNQETLHNEIAAYFSWAVDDEIEKMKLDCFEVTEKGHGRISTRKVTATREVGWFESKGEWAFLRTFVMVERKTVVGENVTHEKQYYISSLEDTAQRFYHLVKGHWSIENQLHWVLDVSFGEDGNLIHKDHSPENLSLVRKLALALLKKDTSRKASLRRKQKIAGWDNTFLESILSIK